MSSSHLQQRHIANSTASNSSDLSQTRNKSNQYPVKLICAGFHRGGTTSLANALKILNYGHIWHTVINCDEWIGTKGLLDWINYKYDKRLRSKPNNVDLDEWVQSIKGDILMDAPVELYWDKFFDEYPNAKVILSVRDFDKWYNSAEKILLNVFLSQPITFLSYFAKTAYWARYIYVNQYAKEMELRDKEKAKQKYFEKIEYVKKKVPSEQLLIYKLGSGWKPLCEFLNKNIPSVEYPYSNNSVSVTKFVYIGLICEIIFTMLVYGSIAAGVWLLIYGYYSFSLIAIFGIVLIWYGFV